MASCGDGDPADARARQRTVALDDLPLQVLLRPKSVVIEQLRGEGADVRMQPPGPLQEQAERRQGWSGGSPSRCCKRRRLRPGRMRPLDGLLQLLRVAQQHDRLGRARRWPGCWPARSGRPHPRTARRPSRRAPGSPTARRCRQPTSTSPVREGRGESGVVIVGGRVRAGRGRLSDPASGRCAPARSAFRAAADRPSSSRLPMTLWLLAVTPTACRPRDQLARSCRAPVYVLPEPGGPWMAQHRVVDGQPMRDRGIERRLAVAAQWRVDVPGRRGVRRRSSRSRAARRGPGASMPCSATQLPSSMQRPLLVVRAGCTRAGSGRSAGMGSLRGPRVSSTVPAIWSMARTLPSLSPVAGSTTPAPSRIGVLLRRESVAMDERLLDPTRPTPS